MPLDDASALEKMRAHREALVRRIRQSQETIERSQELIRRVDEWRGRAKKSQDASAKPCARLLARSDWAITLGSRS
jgi:hypothetical protein